MKRRYDIDWLRTLAMGMLIIYHVVISFQPWAIDIFFIQNEQTLEGLWFIMAMINVWRIPILFMISGMGVRFAMEHRNWKQLLKDRTVRILLPFVFGTLFICPISVFVVLSYSGAETAYFPNPGHLWFLSNIFLYVLLLLPILVYLKNHSNNFFLKSLSKIFRSPYGLYIIGLAIIVETWILNPEYFTLYIDTLHGFFLGLICFLIGFLFISLNEIFWQAVVELRRKALLLAFLLYIIRLLVIHETESNLLIPIESFSWMLAILGYGSVYFNKPSIKLTYFSKAVYPIYIIHMPIQFIIAYYLFPLNIPAILKLGILLLGTFGTCLLLYEYVLRRLKWIRHLFGMKMKMVNDS